MPNYFTDVEVYVINYILNAAYWIGIRKIRFSYQSLLDCTNDYCAVLNEELDEPVDELDYMKSVVDNIKQSQILKVTPINGGYWFTLTELSDSINLPGKPTREGVIARKIAKEREAGHVQ